MIGRQVQQRPGERTHRRSEVQLLARQLDREHRVRLRRDDRVDERLTDVADRNRPQPGGAQHRLEHVHRRGRASGAGHREPWGGVGSSQPPREFDLAPHRNAAHLCCDQQRVGRTQSRRDDDEVDLGELGDRAEPMRATLDEAGDRRRLGRGRE
jgi:hypothetical protein